MSARVPCGTCGSRRGRHSHAPAPNRVAAATKALGFILLAAAVLFATQAHADVPDPCATGAYDPDAGVTLRLDVPLPDGGAEDLPVALCPGQRAPAPMIAFTVRENAKRVAERAQLRTENQLWREAATQAKGVPGWAWLVTCGATVLTGAYCAGHDCNPLHLGRK